MESSCKMMLCLMGNDSALQAAVSASDPASADGELQQGSAIHIADEDSKGEAIVVPDSDDDEDWGPPARGIPAPPPGGTGGPTGGSPEPDQAAAPSNSEEPNAAEPAPAPDGADFGKALDDDRPKVCYAPHSSDAGPKCMQMNICAVPTMWLMVSGTS